ncbi:MAG: hypothetical protein AAFR21_02680 [Pseudomonadota bacterium]
MSNSLNPKIEGGIDAVVLGGGFDAFATSALLGKAGLQVVQVEAGLRPFDHDRWQFSEGFYADEADDLVFDLDADLVKQLDLYRFGLKFARRRIASVYRFRDGATLKLDGDLTVFREAVAGNEKLPAETVSELVEDIMGHARHLRSELDAGNPGLANEAHRHPTLSALMNLPAEAVFCGLTDNTYLVEWLLSEALLRRQARPDDPQSGAALVQNWAGQVLGLQGAVGYPVGGLRSLTEAARRAAQAHGVNFRQAARVDRLLVEWDAAAGVELEDGSQIRAPIVISTLPVEEAFDRHVGRDRLDIEFSQALEKSTSEAVFAKVVFALPEGLPDGFFSKNADQRMVFPISQADLYRAHRTSRHQAPTETVLTEIFFHGNEKGKVPRRGPVTGQAVLGPFSLTLLTEHPEVALTCLTNLLVDVEPALSGKVTGLEILSTGARSNVHGELKRRAACLTGAGINGYYVCGPDGDPGPGGFWTRFHLPMEPGGFLLDNLSLGSGRGARQAAQSAIRYYRTEIA